MNLIIKKHIKFENLKRFISIGVMFAGVIGLLWAVLYWRNDIQFAIGVIFIHILCGAILSLCMIGLMNILGIRINLTSLLGFLLGVFWISPILLYEIKVHYMSLDVSIKGLLVTAVTVSGISLLGLLGGYFLERFSRLTRLFFAIAFGLIVPVYFVLMFPGMSNSKFTIVNRLNEAQREIQPETRVMVLGIDGGTWDVIVPLLKQGKLPNLRALMENGQYGILTSLKDNTSSPVVWTSIFTGKLPMNHGITEWAFSDSRNRFSKSLWNILNDYNQETITVNIPGTFPPEKIVGVQISGFPIPGITKAKVGTIQQYGRLYTTESRDLKVVPTTKIWIKPAEKWLSIPSSYSPLYESRITIAESVRMKYRAYSLHLESLFLEFLDRKGIFQAQERYATLSMLIADTDDDSTANYDTLYVFLKKNDRNPVAVLKEGEWSDWIPLSVNGVETQFKLRLLSFSKDRLEIYATPLFQSSFSPQIPFTYPLNTSSELSKEIGQYVVQEVGWKICKDEVTLGLLYEHIEDVSTQQVRASEYLLKTFPDWRLFVHVFTESDRVMHSY